MPPVGREKLSKLGMSATPRPWWNVAAKTDSTLSITYLEPVQVAAGLWLLRWQSTGTGPFRVFRDGVQIASTYLSEVYVYTDEDDEAPMIEVLSDPNADPISARSGRLVLRWGSVSGTDKYLIDHSVAGSWERVAEIADDGAAAFGYRTDQLDDDADEKFRVSPLDTSGNNGTALPLDKYIVRHPDPPDDVTMEYDLATGKIAVVGMN